jgi:uncharacterized protein (TIGR00251 family)
MATGETPVLLVMIHFTPQREGILFAVKVVPGASRDKIAGEYDGGLKVTVSSPPQNGAANDAVIAVLSNHLRIPKNRIEITHGHSRARKIVRVTDLSMEELQNRLKTS